jgi:hypothetical protein
MGDEKQPAAVTQALQEKANADRLGNEEAIKAADKRLAAAGYEQAAEKRAAAAEDDDEAKKTAPKDRAAKAKATGE